jgi:hypothetical protein
VHELAESADELARLVERALQLPEPAESWWHRPGVSPRGARWLEAVSSLVVGTLAVAWLWTVAEARDRGGAGDGGALTPTTRAVTAALTRSDAPSTAYLADAALAALMPLRGASGRVRVVQQVPGEPIPATLPAGAAVLVDPEPGMIDSGVAGPADSAAGVAGAASATGVDSARADDGDAVHQLAVRVGRLVRPVADLQVVTLTPLSRRRRGRIGLYYIGSWPTESRAVRAAAPARGDYAPPRGLIEVTRANQHTQLSEHLRLRDFLTHDQAKVWPKYVVVQPRLIDKLELVLADLAARGIRPEGIHVMSGFRTPQYNTGGGDSTGRASFSRHMYGDAADIWIDNDGDGRMDDLDRNGRIDVGDAAVIQAAVDRVEAAYPELVGGCGIYPATPAHGPFAHVDARGYRARWLGSGDGG